MKHLSVYAFYNKPTVWDNNFKFEICAINVLCLKQSIYYLKLVQIVSVFDLYTYFVLNRKKCSFALIYVKGQSKTTL